MKNQNRIEAQNRIVDTTKRMVGRIVAGAYYDSQEVRISTMNRMRDVVRKKVEGIAFDEVEGKKEKKNFEKKYTDPQLFDLLEKSLKEGKMTNDEFDYIMKTWKISRESEKVEKKYKDAMMEYISIEPAYYHFLKNIRGIGPVLSANLIKEFGDCSRYDNVGKLWAHTGNFVNGNGIAPKLKKGKTAGFNPDLRTLTWKISDCLMKQNKGYYRKVYVEEKKKQLAREYEEGCLQKKYGKPYKKSEIKLRKGHAHNRALRKMRKLFLSHYWSCARELAGLETRELYVVEKLGHKNIVSWKDAVKMETAHMG